jgi:hypothetical protein
MELLEHLYAVQSDETEEAFQISAHGAESGDPEQMAVPSASH